LAGKKSALTVMAVFFSTPVMVIIAFGASVAVAVGVAGIAVGKMTAVEVGKGVEEGSGSWVGASVGSGGNVVAVASFTVSADSVWATSVRIESNALSISSGETVGELPGKQAVKDAIKIILKIMVNFLISNSFI
jgi:hypothetical protein